MIPNFEVALAIARRDRLVAAMKDLVAATELVEAIDATANPCHTPDYHSIADTPDSTNADQQVRTQTNPQDFPTTKALPPYSPIRVPSEGYDPGSAWNWAVLHPPILPVESGEIKSKLSSWSSKKKQANSLWFC
jgi:hypothetical protein